LILSFAARMVGSTPTRFRQYALMDQPASKEFSGMRGEAMKPA